MTLYCGVDDCACVKHCLSIHRGRGASLGMEAALGVSGGWRTVVTWWGTFVLSPGDQVLLTAG